MSARLRAAAHEGGGNPPRPAVKDHRPTSGGFHGGGGSPPHRADQDAEFIRCRIAADKKKIVRHTLNVWQLDDPGVLLRVAGTTPTSYQGSTPVTATSVGVLTPAGGPRAQLLGALARVARLRHLRRVVVEALVVEVDAAARANP